MKHDHSIKRLHSHKNVLYTLVIILVILQITAFFVLSSKATQLLNQQRIFSNLYSQSMNDLKIETQYKVDEITRVLQEHQQELQAQRSNLTTQIQLLRNAQGDFSGIIGDVLRGVVSVGTDISGGTGFAVAPEGYIITNEHVIHNARTIRVLASDGTVHDARLIGADASKDIAVLQTDASLDALSFADSDDISVGEKVIAVGNPLGLSFTVTEGIVSAVHREGPNGLKAYIQTDVTLNPGNSGGPLINREGKVIGINNFKIGDAEGLGFALESNLVRGAIDEIVANAEVSHA